MLEAEEDEELEERFSIFMEEYFGLDSNLIRDVELDKHVHHAADSCYTVEDKRERLKYEYLLQK